MTENKLKEFCEKNKGKRIRVVLESNNWQLGEVVRGALLFLRVDGQYRVKFFPDEISSLTVED